MVGQSAGPQRVPVGLASGSSLAGSAWLAFVLAWVWLAFLRICFDFGLISVGFRFDFGWISVVWLWLDLA